MPTLQKKKLRSCAYVRKRDSLPEQHKFVEIHSYFLAFEVIHAFSVAIGVVIVFYSKCQCME